MELLSEKPSPVGSVVGRRVLGACDICGEERMLVASIWLEAWTCTACKQREFELQPHPGGIPRSEYDDEPEWPTVQAAIERAKARRDSAG